MFRQLPPLVCHRICRLPVVLLLTVLAACQPTTFETPPTLPPFPTMTPGRTLRGILPTVVSGPVEGSGLANPATAIALANQPTPSPDQRICPPLSGTQLGELPNNGRAIERQVTDYLSDGGAPAGLTAWAQGGVVRADVDFTGEGTSEVLLTYRAPDDGGTLLILGCVNGVYTLLYQAVTGGDPPQMIHLGDMNFDGRAEALFSSLECSAETPDDCAYRTQLITWQADTGRFVSLLTGVIASFEPPAVSDIDNDRVLEVVVRLTDPGSAITGPLRTGVNIYDWNGAFYTLSIVQLDPPRYKIQVIQEADRAFGRLDMESAVSLYELSLTDTGLGYWINDEPPLLNSYALYRLMLAHAYTEDERLLPTYQALLQTYLDPATAPVYFILAVAFWNGFQVTNNLNSACREVQAIIAERPEAVELLNRYGSRSPTISAQDLCPF